MTDDTKDDPFKGIKPLSDNVTPFDRSKRSLNRQADQMRHGMRFAGDIRANMDVEYLIKGWLAPKTLAVIYGPANVGKTFLALDIANAVSQGKEWGSNKVRAAPVLYVSLEGGAGFDRRVVALDGPKFWTLSAPVCLMDKSHHASWLSDAVRHLADEVGDFGLIVIDTLARAMSPGDENSSQDMGRLVASAELLRDSTGACILLVHHTGKSTAQGARGHSSLRAAVDTEIEVSKEEGGDTIEAVATKQRDMEAGRKFAYKLIEVNLGTDSDGDPVTTCVVERVAEEPRRAKVTGKTEIALQALTTAIRDHGALRPCPDIPNVKSITRDQWRDAAERHGMFEGATPESAKRAFRRAIGELNEKALARGFGEIWWLV